MMMSSEQAQSLLQQQLDCSWRAFQNTEQFECFAAFFDWLWDHQFFALRDKGNELPSGILNPAHWYAAQAICEPMLRVAQNEGITFDRILPGSLDANDSFEAQDGGLLDRTFLFGMRINGGWSRGGTMSFFHRHTQFYFVRPPQIKVGVEVAGWPVTQSDLEEACRLQISRGTPNDEQRLAG